MTDPAEQTQFPVAPYFVPPPQDLPYDDGIPLESNRHRIAMNLLIESLLGWRLDARDRYRPIAPAAEGRLWCATLGLWLGTWDGVFQHERAPARRRRNNRQGVGAGHRPFSLLSPQGRPS